jgi:hypothetical protein
VKPHFWFPVEHFLRLRTVTDEQVNLCGPLIPSPSPSCKIRHIASTYRVHIPNLVLHRQCRGTIPLQPVFDRGDCARDFTRDEGFAAARTFVIEQNAIACAKRVALAIIDRRPIWKHFCHTKRAARPEYAVHRWRVLLRHQGNRTFDSQTAHKLDYFLF